MKFNTRPKNSVSKHSGLVKIVNSYSTVKQIMYKHITSHTTMEGIRVISY